MFRNDWGSFTPGVEAEQVVRAMMRVWFSDEQGTLALARPTTITAE